MKTTKIMLIAVVYEYGGVSSVIRNILGILDKNSFNVVFVVERLEQRHYHIKDDIKFINIDVRPAKGSINKIVNLLRHIYQIRTIIVKEKPEVILSFGVSINCLLLLSVLWPVRFMPKVILSEHSEQLFITQKGIPLKQRLCRAVYIALMSLLYRKTDYILAVSNGIAQHMRKLPFIPSSKIKVVHNPVNIVSIQELSKEKIEFTMDRKEVFCVGTVSRLSAEKGVNFLIEGFAKLLKKMDAQLVIVGDGPERLVLERMAIGLGINNKTVFTGWTDNPYKYMAKMDVFVLSSLWEGFPNVVLEAMACKIPVVASNSSGGIREVIRDGVNGILVKTGSSLAISEAVYNLLSDREKREKIAKEGYVSVKNFDINQIKKQYENLILN